MNPRAIPSLLAVLLLLSFTTNAQDWHPVTLPFCSQIKAKGAMVSNRPFWVFEAPAPNSRCCADLDLKFKGKTEQFGYFKLSGLPKGRYFVSFDLKAKHVTVPLSVERIIDYEDCLASSRITLDKVTGQMHWEEWINVD